LHGQGNQEGGDVPVLSSLRGRGQLAQQSASLAPVVLLCRVRTPHTQPAAAHQPTNQLT
jgi:hypothetical protein